MKFESTLGYVKKIEFLKFMFWKIDIAFKKDKLAAETPFAKAYGIKGIFFSDLDDEIPSSPLVIVQSKDLAVLVAAKQLADCLQAGERYTEMAIQERTEEIYKKYLIETGMSEEAYRSLSNILK
jgi:hypothetical protein